MTHSRLPVLKCSARWIDGRATFTMEASSTTISWAVAITTSASPSRWGRAGSPSAARRGASERSAVRSGSGASSGSHASVDALTGCATFPCRRSAVPSQCIPRRGRSQPAPSGPPPARW